MSLENATRSELKAASDKEVLEARRKFKSGLLPNARELMNEDSYLRGAIKNFSQKQREVFTDLVADYAAVKRFRRVRREDVRKETLPGGTEVSVDPLRNRYSRRLQKAGFDETGLINIITTASETVLTFYHSDNAPLYIL